MDDKDNGMPHSAPPSPGSPSGKISTIAPSTPQSPRSPVGAFPSRTRSIPRSARTSAAPNGSATSSQQMAKESPSVAEMDAFKETLKCDFEHIIYVELLAFSFRFKALLETSEFSHESLKELLEDTEVNVARVSITSPSSDVSDGSSEEEEKAQTPKGAEVFRFVNGMVPSNARLVKIIEIVRPMLREAVECVNKARLWMMLMIPRIEDGNNFGVSVLQEAIAGARAIETAIAAFIDGLSNYFLNRAGLISKLAKYPDVATGEEEFGESPRFGPPSSFDDALLKTQEDYRRAILDIDEKQFLNSRIVLIEMRNNFAIMHDMIVKNINKINNPRNTDTVMTY